MLLLLGIMVNPHHHHLGFRGLSHIVKPKIKNKKNEQASNKIRFPLYHHKN